MHSVTSLEPCSTAASVVPGPGSMAWPMAWPMAWAWHGRGINNICRRIAIGSNAAHVYLRLVATNFQLTFASPSLIKLSVYLHHLIIIFMLAVIGVPCLIPPRSASDSGKQPYRHYNSVWRYFWSAVDYFPDNFKPGSIARPHSRSFRPFLGGGGLTNTVMF